MRKRKRRAPLTQQEQGLLEANLDLIRWQVHRMHPGSAQDAEDWIQEGVFAAAHALRTHDATKGTVLSTWIVRIVRNHLLKYIQRQGVITRPSESGDAGCRRRWRQRVHRANRVVSLSRIPPCYHPLDDDWDVAYDEEALRIALRRLPKLDQKILHWRFYKERGFPDIAKQLGVTHQAVQKRVHRLLGKLHESYCLLSGMAS